MIDFIWDPSFKRSYKKNISRNSILKKKFWTALNAFSKNPFDARLKTHKLTGKLQGLWAFSIDYDCRVVFNFLDSNKLVLLIDIGSQRGGEFPSRAFAERDVARSVTG